LRGFLTESAAPHVEVEPGQPTLLIDRLYLDTAGAPIELSASHLLPD
jgi:GntR family transcriptional regulator